MTIFHFSCFQFEDKDFGDDIVCFCAIYFKNYILGFAVFFLSFFSFFFFRQDDDDDDEDDEDDDDDEQTNGKLKRISENPKKRYKFRIIC